MAKLKITEHPAPVLAQAGAAVTKFDDELAQLAADMYETMYAAKGVGLAAQQVGRAVRFFVMDCAGVKLEAANPEILSADGTQTGDEGCLSVGVIAAVLTRPNIVTFRAQNLQGEWFERTVEGFAARCVLHETDHCDGKLFISRLAPLRREMVLKRFQKIKKFRGKNAF
jgi:peptide deformylase